MIPGMFIEDKHDHEGRLLPYPNKEVRLCHVPRLGHLAGRPYFGRHCLRGTTPSSLIHATGILPPKKLIDIICILIMMFAMFA